MQRYSIKQNFLLIIETSLFVVVP